MQKRTAIIVTGTILAVLLIGCAVAAFLVRYQFSDEQMEQIAAPVHYSELYIGETRIEEYGIIAGYTDRKSAEEVNRLIEMISGNRLEISSSSSADQQIRIDRLKKEDPTPAGIKVENGKISISGHSSDEINEQIKIFANEYLGIAFAGEEREHILETNGGKVCVPADVRSMDLAYIQKREPIICLWKTTAPRGVTYNPATSLKSEILSYSDDQLYSYVKMMKVIGYTGIQVTDMCSAWAYYGNYQFVHDRIRYMADSAHSLGMDFTLWVWGAEFNGYGWVDDSVDYNRDKKFEKAFENPSTCKTFEKYYSIYAELADCCDRVITHFNDPGNLRDTDEIAYFAGNLRDKFRSINPDVDFGVSCYTHEIDVREISELMNGDVTVYLGARAYKDADWSYERSLCSEDEIAFGIWSWNLTEMEIDQLALMNVNATIIKNTYQRTAEQDAIAKPSYWSEMDSYHVLNLFSHYCAANLLVNPEFNEDALLFEVSEKVVGKEFAGELYEVLKLIEDARSGNSMESFRCECDEYILKSPDYDWMSIEERSETCLSFLQHMIKEEPDDNTIPLPMSVSDLLKLIVPHVQQIHDFAVFRENLSKLYFEAECGTDPEQINSLIEEAGIPIKEYNVIVGVWGIPEARAQYDMLSEFCNQYGYEMPQDPTFTFYRKMKIYSEFVTWQRKSKGCASFSKSAFQWSAAYGTEETIRLTEELIKDGLLTENADGTVYVTNWENYKFDF